MTKLEWGLVAIAVGLGIMSQIPNHDDMEMDAHEHAAPALEDVAPSLTLVSLDISGMT